MSSKYENLWDFPIEHFNVPLHEFFAMKPNAQRRPQHIVFQHNTILTSSIMFFFVAQ